MKLLILLVSIGFGAQAERNVSCPFPFEKTGEPVSVTLTFQFYSLDEFQDVEGYLFLSGTIVGNWYDPCGWQLAERRFPRRIENRTSVFIELDYIWTPVICQDSTIGLRAFENSGDMPLEVHKSGYITQWGRKLWRADCKGSFNKFPFDKHTCQLAFFSWEPAEFVRIVNVKETTVTFGYDVNKLPLFSAVIQPVTFSAFDYLCGNSTCTSGWATFSIVLERKWFPYYLNNIFLPILLLAILQLSAFFIPHDEIDRITFSGTIFLSNALITNYISSHIPQTSEQVVIVFTSNIATIGSMLAIVFFTFSFLYKDSVENEQMMTTIQKSGTVAFIAFYLILFLISILLLVI